MEDFYIMARIIDISERMSTARPKLVIGDRSYES